MTVEGALVVPASAGCETARNRREVAAIRHDAPIQCRKIPQLLRIFHLAERDCLVVVVTNEPMPRVSKKFVMNPMVMNPMAL